MKALTLIEPWGWCIAHAGKRYEHRSWEPWASIVGKRIAIHAGKSYDEWARERIMRGIPGLHVPAADVVPRGIIAVATVLGTVHREPPNADGGPEPVIVEGGLDNGCDLRWYGGGLAWVLHGVRALPEPIPCRGAQGLWDVPADVVAQIEAQLRGLA